MKQFGKAFATLMMVGAWTLQAEAAPPTVTPSPGYDARLQEQRARAALSTPIDPVARRLDRRHHVRRAPRVPAAAMSRNLERW
jgi:hypothetical protein